jgi:AcrR family transcriptional regulator
MPTKAKARTTVGSRDRILNTAIKHFSRNSYERTSLRDIAADVGVDVAYVHRCFGSKEGLFSEAMEASAQVAQLLNAPKDNLAGSLATQALAGRSQRDLALGIFIHSATSPEALPILRQFILDNVIEPLSEEIGGSSTTQATLIAALLTGVSLFRNVLRLKPLLEAEGGELEALIAQAFQSLIDGVDGARALGKLKRA